MGWQDEIEDFLIRSIDLYLKYHIRGKLDGLKVILYIDRGYTEIILTIDGEDKMIDFECFKMASEECERDAQRECYFENESLWAELFGEMGSEESEILSLIEAVHRKLDEYYQVCVQCKCFKG